VKKLTGRVERGSVDSADVLMRCLGAGLEVKPHLRVQLPPDSSSSSAAPPLKAKHLRSFLVHSLSFGAEDAKDSSPYPAAAPLQLGNAAALRGVVVISCGGLGFPAAGSGGEEISARISDKLRSRLQHVGAVRYFSRDHDYPKTIEDSLLYIPVVCDDEEEGEEGGAGGRQEEGEENGRRRRRRTARTGAEVAEEQNGGGAPALQQSLSAYVLSLQEMEKHGYPLPLANSEQLQPHQPAVPACPPAAWPPTWSTALGLVPSLEEASAALAALSEVPGLAGYVSTQPFLPGSSPTEPPPPSCTYGLDCEMCLTSKGLELARVTLVNQDGKEALLDALVLPEAPIMDYLTRWSGITAQTMSPVTTRLCQVQAALLRLVSSRDVLVGHSLENDLKALQLCHLRCVDTAVLYGHGSHGRKSSLRHLSQQYLGRTIQQSGGGHCSEQDARAALDLALLKAARGPLFGMAGAKIHLMQSVEGGGGRCAFVGCPDQCRRHATVDTVSAIVVKQEQAGASHMGATVRAAQAQARAGGTGVLSRPLPSLPGFLWVQMPPPCPPASIQDASGPGGLPAASSCEWERLEGEICRLLDGLPSGTLFAIAAQCNVALVRDLLKQRKLCNSSRTVTASVWSEEQQSQLIRLTQMTREGLLMMGVT
jgi:DNA polymerase III epsilon subunit-like protein